MTNAISPQGIAIIGMAGRFPGASDVESFWDLIAQGREGITRFDSDVLTANGAPPDLVNSPDYVPAKAFVENSECFDAEFFGIPPREAAFLDPQHRIFLECCWHALEDGGYDPGRYSGWIGVYAGEAEQSHLAAILARSANIQQEARTTPTFFGNTIDFLATRVAYKLDLRGPALTVQTACSTSLVAVHLACQALLAYETDMALAGGVSISTPEKEGYLFTHGSVESPDGHCRPFDADAAGTLPSDGAGVVLLKRLEDAIADGDPIRAVIRGTAINNDGARKIGFTAPSVEGQMDAIQLAHRVAEIDPSQIAYVEAHGTGTVMGDPVEIEALTRAFERYQTRAEPCSIGSLKGNLGHLKAAAGIAGLIKTVLALEKQLLPPSINFRTPNPAIQFETTPFRVNTQLRPWPANVPRIAAVSSFGIGGTNAHAVIAAAPSKEERAPANHDKIQLLPLSARDPSDLEAVTSRFTDWLETPEARSVPFDEIVRTLQQGRRHFPSRRAVLAHTHSEAQAALRDRASHVSGKIGATPRPVTFMFPGQGTAVLGMGRGLDQIEESFRADLDTCAATIKTLEGWDLRTALFQGAVPEGSLMQTRIGQPALLAIQWATARLFIHWGIRPDRLVGHSLGEITAACIAGIMPIEAALALACTRGRVMQAAPAGAMLAVANHFDVLGPLQDGISVAAINTRTQCVLSGPEHAIAAQEAAYATRGIQTKRLETKHAFHSALLDDCLAAIHAAVPVAHLVAPSIPIISTLTGKALSDDEARDATYWAKQARNTVRFADAMDAVFAQGDTILIEIGPGETLTRFARRHPSRTPTSELIPSMPNGGRESNETFKALAQLYSENCALDWAAVDHAAGPKRRTHLPLYPFKRTRFHLDDVLKPEPKRAFPERDVGRNRSDLTQLNAVQGLIYAPRWDLSGWNKTTPLPGVTWLIAPSTSPLIHAVRAAVENGNGRLIVMDHHRDADACIDRAKADHFAEWFHHAPPTRIIHAWCWATQDDARERGYETLVALAQGLDRSAFTQDLTVAICASNLLAAESPDRTEPDLSLMLGPARVIQQEMPNCTIGILDAPANIEPATIVAELAHLGSATVALRGHRRLEQGFAPLTLQSGPSPFRVDGHYLITGGLGRLGLALAQCLAERYRARLTLLGRSVPSGGDSWNDRQREALMAIEAAGGHALAIACDVTDARAFKAALEEAEKQWGPLDGLIHGAAETQRFTPLPQMNDGDAQSQFTPKIEGLRSIEDALADRPLSVRVLMSSLASVLGGLGFGAYAAANAWLDAYATASGRWTSFSWDAWSEGLDASPDVASARYAIATSTGFNAMERVLAAGITGHVIVCGGDFDTRRKQWTGRRHDGRHQPATVDGARIQVIAQTFGDVLGITPFAITDSFFDHGGDSLQAIQVIARLRKSLSLPVTPTLFFENPTPELLDSALSRIDQQITSTGDSSAAPSAAQDLSLLSGEDVNRLLDTLLSRGDR